MDIDTLLHKYLNGEATVEEISQLKAHPEFASYLKIAEATRKFEAPNFMDAENLTAIHNSIKKQPKVRSINSLQRFMRIAALFAVVIATYVFVSNRDTKIVTQIAEHETFELPDHSEVTLNAMSKITFNKKDWKKERALTLEGEAFFKVEKGEKFQVNTPQGSVAVLGTQFNVYVRGHQFYVQCYEGLVSVNFNGNDIKVPAGSYAQIENNQLLALTKAEGTAPSWVDFESSFSEASLEAVLNELERQYPITVKNKTIAENKFTGSFTHKNLEVALRSICEPLQLEFKIDDDEVMLYAKNSN